MSTIKFFTSKIFVIQLAIAAGSGASVATDILTLWNNGEHSQVHDKI